MGRDYTRYVERAREDRAEETGIGRLYTGLFIAILGPLALAAMGFLDIDPSRYVMYGIVATAPIGALLGIINAFRLNRFSMGAAWILLFTLAAAGLMAYLYFDDLPGFLS